MGLAPPLLRRLLLVRLRLCVLAIGGVGGARCACRVCLVSILLCVCHALCSGLVVARSVRRWSRIRRGESGRLVSGFGRARPCRLRVGSACEGSRVRIEHSCVPLSPPAPIRVCCTSARPARFTASASGGGGVAAGEGCEIVRAAKIEAKIRTNQISPAIHQ